MVAQVAGLSGMGHSDNMGTPLIAKELQASFRRAVSDAQSRRHELVLLEHLFLALIQDPRAREILTACGADTDRLRKALETFVERVEPVPGKVPVEPRQTIGIERVLQRAAIHALSSEKKCIEASDVLVALYREDESQALQLLKQEGVTRLDLLNCVSHGIPKQEGVVLIEAGLRKDLWDAVEQYRQEHGTQLGREYSLSEALNALVATALGLPPPPTQGDAL